MLVFSEYQSLQSREMCAQFHEHALGNHCPSCGQRLPSVRGSMFHSGGMNCLWLFSQNNFWERVAYNVVGGSVFCWLYRSIHDDTSMILLWYFYDILYKYFLMYDVDIILNINVLACSFFETMIEWYFFSEKLLFNAWISLLMKNLIYWNVLFKSIVASL